MLLPLLLPLLLHLLLVVVTAIPPMADARRVEPERRLINTSISTSTRRTTPAGDASGTCPDQMFRCQDGLCIPASWMCDNDKDCADGDDEDENKCQGTGCTKDEFECASGGVVRRSDYNPLADRAARPKCIPTRWKCDGEHDCDDGSDEKNCPEQKCGPKQHECGQMPNQAGIKICIPESWKCDKQTDCADGSDEANCPDGDKKNHTCGDEEFSCENGVCIFQQWHCDGDNDCGDNSDESSCSRNCSAESQFTCHSNNFCIPKKWRCDGEHDCIDASDERDCTKEEIGDPLMPDRRLHPRTCKPSEFPCKSGDHCINKAWMCDYDNDCPDASDEDALTCPDKKSQCDPSMQFRCVGDGTCRDLIARCNGLIDCTDGSDEANCTTNAPASSVPCNKGDAFSCDNGYCIGYDTVCDGVAQCPNGVDEQGCDKEIGTCSKTDLNCKCRKVAKGGELCTCAPGFAHAADKSCKDINECLLAGLCGQKCENTPGSYKCSCHHGYVLQPNGNCRANGEDPKLLLSNRVTIRQVDLTTHEYQPLIGQLDSAVAMDFLHRNNTLIWSDVAQERIMICHLGNHTRLNSTSQCLDGRNSSLVADGISTPDGLAIDWVHDLLFWTDTGMDSISVMHLGSRHRRTLFNTSLDEPRAIAVDPRAGVIFWTDWGTPARIERAGMDGSFRMTVIQGDDIKWPNGLALDLLEQRVYWADAKMKMISSADYWGNERRMVLQSWSALKHPFSLSVFEERLYWTDWDQEGVLTANKFTGKDFTNVVQGISGPMTVRVYHELTQPLMPNKCEFHRCSELCLPRPHIPLEAPTATDAAIRRTAFGRPYTCACRDGHSSATGTGDDCMISDGGSSSSSSIQTTTTTSTTTTTATTSSPRSTKSMTPWVLIHNTDDFLVSSIRPVSSRAPPPSASSGHHSAPDASGQKELVPGTSSHAAEEAAAAADNEGSGFTSFLILLLLAMVAAAVGYVWYRQRSAPLRALNFDNPVYRKTVEEADSDQENFTDHNGSAPPGARLKLSLDTENYNPSRTDAIVADIHSNGFISESARQPLTQAMA